MSSRSIKENAYILPVVEQSTKRVRTSIIKCTLHHACQTMASNEHALILHHEIFPTNLILTRFNGPSKDAQKVTPHLAIYRGTSKELFSRSTENQARWISPATIPSTSRHIRRGNPAPVSLLSA
ncbi:hypothetical protein SAY86_018286 [Trapa natans]|uniref:Uncharacterized protein n=1 Tax=Trapa natans TaxID=22666 RepID=A0AAN7R300_TRANT|nr:hypothetical protein SAY86_018286 [Trapa natans]